MKETKLLFAAAEIFPFAKSGGLADMASALSRALHEKIETTAIMPLYRFIDKDRFGIVPTGERFSLDLGGVEYDVELFHAKHDGLEVLFVYNPTLCDRDEIYGPAGEGYGDNDIRFAIFSHAIVETVRRFGFTTLHLNDWHTALAAVLARDEGVRCSIVYTIHNLAYQGVFESSSAARWGMAESHLHIEDMEFYGRLNWMKGGIAHADVVTTVSPSYAIEIQRAEFGCGLDGFLRRHRDKLVGILNGIDEKVYDPAHDRAIAAPYTSESLRGKGVCKRGLVKTLSFDDPARPLLAFIGRFVEQKGLDLLIGTMEQLLGRNINLVVLGEGEAKYRDALKRIDSQYGNFRLIVGYDDDLSHRIYAAADFFMMPSRFEPCGLGQMIAMRYGSIPIVHAVGGLRDTVHPIRRNEKVCGQGFLFEAMDEEALLAAVDDALELYKKTASLRRVRQFDMQCDFSIERCALKYIDLYRSLP